MLEFCCGEDLDESLRSKKGRNMFRSIFDLKGPKNSNEHFLGSCLCTWAQGYVHDFRLFRMHACAFVHTHVLKACVQSVDTSCSLPTSDNSTCSWIGASEREKMAGLLSTSPFLRMVHAFWV